VIVFLSPYSSTSAFASHAIGTVNYRSNTLVQFQQAVDEVSGARAGLFGYLMAF